VTAGLWRILLMPIDTAKTCLQVDGGAGFQTLKDRVLSPQGGVSVLFNGAVAASAATFVGHFPWFLVFNYLSSNLETPEEFLRQLCKIALEIFIAFLMIIIFCCFRSS
jgi:hypothetical protein